MKRPSSTLLSLVVALLALSASAVHAQNVAVSYRFTPVQGKATALEQAIKSHAAWRTQAKDPWTWSVFQIVTGNYAGSFIIMSGGHTWADLDAYDAGFGPKGSARFTADVGPFVSSWNSSVMVRDSAHTLLPEDNSGYNLISVTLYDVKPGKWYTFSAAVDQAHKAIVKGNMPTHYAWFNLQDSGPGQVRGIAIFCKNWAEFQEPHPNLAEVMTKEYGSQLAGDIYDNFSSSYGKTESWIMRFRPDLSVQHQGN